jgi:hypothetical protein
MADHAMFISKGQCAIVLGTGERFDKWAPQMFGERCLFADGQVRNATVKALTPVAVVHIKQRTVLNAMRLYPKNTFFYEAYCESLKEDESPQAADGRVRGDGRVAPDDDGYRTTAPTVNHTGPKSVETLPIPKAAFQGTPVPGTDSDSKMSPSYKASRLSIASEVPDEPEDPDVFSDVDD